MASSARPRGGGAASAQRILAIMENKRHEVGFAFLDLQRPVLELKQWLEQVSGLLLHSSISLCSTSSSSSNSRRGSCQPPQQLN